MHTYIHTNIHVNYVLINIYIHTYIHTGESEVVPTRSSPLWHGVGLSRKPFAISLEVSPLLGSGKTTLPFIHTYILTYIHTYMHTYMHTYIHTCVHTYIHIHTNKDMAHV